MSRRAIPAVKWTTEVQTGRATPVRRLHRFQEPIELTRQILVGGLVFGNAFGANLQYHEWTSFLSDGEFCFRACVGPKAKSLCNHIYDVMGCWWVSTFSVVQLSISKAHDNVLRTFPPTTIPVSSRNVLATPPRRWVCTVPRPGTRVSAQPPRATLPPSRAAARPSRRCPSLPCVAAARMVNLDLPRGTSTPAMLPMLLSRARLQHLRHEVFSSRPRLVGRIL